MKSGQDTTGSATPHERLIRELMDWRVPKSEREWCAAREIEDMLTFIREQVKLWDNDGDSGFPLYVHGKQILTRYKSPNDMTPLLPCDHDGCTKTGCGQPSAIETCIQFLSVNGQNDLVVEARIELARLRKAYDELIATEEKIRKLKDDAFQSALACLDLQGQIDALRRELDHTNNTPLLPDKA